MDMQAPCTLCSCLQWMFAGLAVGCLRTQLVAHTWVSAVSREVAAQTMQPSHQSAGILDAVCTPWHAAGPASSCVSSSQTLPKTTDESILGRGTKQVLGAQLSAHSALLAASSEYTFPPFLPRAVYCLPGARVSHCKSSGSFR